MTTLEYGDLANNFNCSFMFTIVTEHVYLIYTFKWNTSNKYLSGEDRQETFTSDCLEFLHSYEGVEELDEFGVLHQEGGKLHPLYKADYRA